MGPGEGMKTFSTKKGGGDPTAWEVWGSHIRLTRLLRSGLVEENRACLTESAKRNEWSFLSSRGETTKGVNERERDGTSSAGRRALTPPLIRSMSSLPIKLREKQEIREPGATVKGQVKYP